MHLGSILHKEIQELTIPTVINNSHFGGTTPCPLLAWIPCNSLWRGYSTDLDIDEDIEISMVYS